MYVVKEFNEKDEYVGSTFFKNFADARILFNSLIDRFEKYSHRVDRISFSEYGKICEIIIMEYNGSNK